MVGKPKGPTPNSARHKPSRYEDEADDEPGAIASEGYTLPSAVAQRIRLSEMKPRERPPASPPNDEWIL